ncbi:MAG: nucleotide sugar dehydrogenase [Anaerolineaceae bacterium]|nr:nucleotide sugar dehydrogenase [Anaerolineaceae bacterium]
MNFEKVCVIGLGYIGLPTAATLAAHSLQVTGVDTNAHVVSNLQNGQVHIREGGLNALVQSVLEAGRLTIRSAPEKADAFIIAVPTPFYEDKRADLSAVMRATEAIAPVLAPGNLVVLESTSPPGTTRNLVVPILERSGLKAGRDFYVAYSPERVLPGQILRELVENARVIGGIDAASAEAGCDLYRIFVKGEIILTDCTTAEMVKLMENTSRDINIAIANEFSRLADHLGIDIWEAVKIANLHPRVNILQPGPGVGGHCISVDPWFLVEAAPHLTPLIRTARQVNDAQPRFVLQIIERAAGGSLAGMRIGILGLSYKPNVDDLRESPAIQIAYLLKEAGAVITAYEPNCPAAVLEGLNTVSALQPAVQNAELLVLLVAHETFRQLQPQELVQLTPARAVVDCVHLWNHPSWQQAGFTVHFLGVRKE